MAGLLSKMPVVAHLAVKDMKRAGDFYEQKLGLEVAEPGDMWRLYKTGDGSTLAIYPSEYAGTNKATAAGWKVDDLDEVMKALRDKGVEFENYDVEGLKTEAGVATWEEAGKTGKGAWFKDPDGNILSLFEM